MTEQSHSKLRSWGEVTETEEMFLDNLPTITVVSGFSVAVLLVGEYVNWWAAVCMTIAAISFGLMRNWDRIGLFIGNPFGRIDPEAYERRLFGTPDDWSMVQPMAQSVTEAEIDAIGVVMAPMLPLHDDEVDDPVADYHGEYTLPPPARWRVFLRDVWQNQHWRFAMSVICWPVSFWIERTAKNQVTWTNMTTADKRRQAEMEATDRAEEVMWWAICLTFPSLLVYGWYQENTWVSLWHVLGSYGVSCVKLWLALMFRRN